MTALAGEVLELASAWLPANDHPARPLMQLATVDPAGRPDARTVLLSGWDEEGFRFHTDRGSRKAAELAEHPAAALVLLFEPAFSRQLVIRGDVAQTSTAEQATTWAARSPYLRQLAWQNTPELAALPREERTAAWSAFAAERVADASEPAPSWIGFRLEPRSLTFWESDPAGPSHRREYRAGPGGWSLTHLPG